MWTWKQIQIGISDSPDQINRNIVYDIVCDIACDMKTRTYDVLPTTYDVAYDCNIRHRMWNMRHRMLHTTSYVIHTISQIAISYIERYDIVCAIIPYRNTISYVLTYDIAIYDIVCKNIRYRMLSSLLYDIVCLTYDIVCWQESRCSTYNLLMIHSSIWAFTYPTYELLSLLTTVVCRGCFWIQFCAFYWQKHQATEHSRQGLAAYGPTAIAGWQETTSSHPRRLAVSLVLDVLALSDTCKWQVPEIAVNDVLKACAN